MPAEKRTWRYKVRPVRIDGDVAYITLSSGAVAVIDAADAPHVSAWNWTARSKSAGSTVYVTRGGPTGVIHLGRALLGIADGRFVDHRDGDGLNNRRANLRVATRRQNAWNRKIGSANSSGFKGVCYRSDRSTWLAAITSEGRLIKIGTFSAPEDAARAYDEQARRLFGPFAALNFPTPGERSARNHTEEAA